MPPLRVAWSTGCWVFTRLSPSSDTICVGSRRPSLSPCRRGTPAHVRAPLLSTGPLDVVQTWGKEMGRRTVRGDFQWSLFFVDHLRASDGASAEAGVVAHGMQPVASCQTARGAWEKLDPPISCAQRPWDDSEGTQRGGNEEGQNTEPHGCVFSSNSLSMSLYGCMRPPWPPSARNRCVSPHCNFTPLQPWGVG